jgi:hypothetical protein
MQVGTTAQHALCTLADRLLLAADEELVSGSNIRWIMPT